MRHNKQIFGLSVMFLGCMTLSEVAQAQFQAYPPPPAIDYLKPEQISPRRYPKQNLCHSILSSEWRHYQRKRAAGANYPTAEDIRLQRKWESKKGCPHLYEADGTVNRVPGINN
jgi:hypothetical protein